MVKSIDVKSSEMNKTVSTKLNEISNEYILPSQHSSFSSSHTHQTPTKQMSFSTIMKQQKLQQRIDSRLTPSNKCKLTYDPSTKVTSTKPKDIPPAKMGKRTGCVLAVAPAPVKPSRRQKSTDDQSKPSFDKSLHVSRIATSVTVDDMNAFVANESKLSLNVDFKCTRLVKRINPLSLSRSSRSKLTTSKQIVTCSPKKIFGLKVH